MAGNPRPPPHRLKWLAALERAPFEFDFHAALRRLESIFRDRPRFGEAMRPADEPVRFGQEPSTAFAPSAIASFRQLEGDPRGKMNVSFFGMFGPHGALPVHITEYARDRLRNAGDRTLVSFVDLFHHRMLLLFHRAWTQAQPTASQDRPESNGFSTYVGALFGLALRSALGRDPIADDVKRYYAGRLGAQTKNAEGLRAIVADYLDLPVAIEEFVGEWLVLPVDGRWSLGASQEASSLGRTTVLGGRVWQCNSKFRVTLGPLSREDFRRMLPGSKSLEKLTALVRTYVGDEFDWDVRLVRRRGESDQLQLSGDRALGYDTRLGPSHGRERGEDLIVNPLLRQTIRSLSRAT
jgi:type VI secretion system protein ImpH